jgi:hypothetical protein
MPKALQWGLLVFFICALVASMAIASVTLFLFWEHNRPRNYLFYRIAEGSAAMVSAFQGSHHKATLTPARRTPAGFLHLHSM